MRNPLTVFNNIFFTIRNSILNNSKKLASEIPNELKTSLKKMSSIDNNCVQLQEQLYQLIKDAQQAKIDQNSKRLKQANSKIETIFGKLEAMSDQKISIANSVYDLVDAKIQQVDEYIEKFDSEVKEISVLNSVEQNDNLKNTTQHGSIVDIFNNSFENISVNSQNSKLDTTMDIEMPIDDDEPTYCVCKQVSFGKMVACDNRKCPIEWFHFKCMGLTKNPKGSWFCPMCRKNGL